LNNPADRQTNKLETEASSVGRGNKLLFLLVTVMIGLPPLRYAQPTLTQIRKTQVLINHAVFCVYHELGWFGAS